MNKTKYISSSDFCKSHSARLGKDIMCFNNVTSLSRAELEDLYFTSINSNFELKKTVNDQNEKLKLLSTKLFRLTALQKVYAPKEEVKRHAGGLSLVYEQNETIEDLKKTNENMSEKIRQLSMKLCSAKQFLKTNKTYRSSLYRKSSSTFLNTKRSEVNIQNSDVSSGRTPHSVNSDKSDKSDKINIMKSVETNTEHGKGDASNRSCDNNKCKTVIERFRNKVTLLDQELQKSRDIQLHLEHEVASLQEENLSGRAEYKHLEENCRESELRITQLADHLAHAEANYNNIQMELSLQTKKLIETETQLKSSELTNEVVKIIEDHLCHQLTEGKSTDLATKCQDCLSTLNTSFDNTEVQTVQQQLVTSSTGSRVNLATLGDDVWSKSGSTPVKSSDDSGYTETTNFDQNYKSLCKVNDDLKQRLTHLQSQLDMYKISYSSDSNTMLRKITEDLQVENETSHNIETPKTTTNTKSPVKMTSECSYSTTSVLPVKRVINIKAPSEEHCSAINSNTHGITYVYPVTNDDTSHIPTSVDNKDYIVHKDTSSNKTNINYESQKPTRPSSRLSESNTPTRNIANYTKGSNNKTGYTQIQQNKHSGISKEITANVKENIGESSSKKSSVHNTYSLHDRHGSGDCDKRSVNNISVVDNTADDVTTIENTLSTGDIESLSVGEERDRDLYSDDAYSCSDTFVSSEYGYLSEGEVPRRREAALSVGEKYVPKMNLNISVPSETSKTKFVEDALLATRRELQRCTHLLRLRPAHEKTK